MTWACCTVDCKDRGPSLYLAPTTRPCTFWFRRCYCSNRWQHDTSERQSISVPRCNCARTSQCQRHYQARRSPAGIRPRCRCQVTMRCRTAHAAGSYCAPCNGRGPPLLHLELPKPSQAMYIPHAAGLEGTRTRRSQQPATGRQSDAQSQWARFSCTGSIGCACITQPRKSGPTNSLRRTPFQHGRTDRSAHDASLHPM